MLKLSKRENSNMARCRISKKYGFFIHADIPIYVVIKRNKYLYALHWYDLDNTWVHDETNIDDINNTQDGITVQLSFLEWVQHLKVSGISKYPRHLVSYSAKQVARLNEIFAGDKLRSADIDMFAFNEIQSTQDLIGLNYKGGV